MQERQENPSACPIPSREPSLSRIENCTLRWVTIVFGWANVALGVVGIVVPGMPTTVFLLIALWAFSKSSVRFQTWLWNHDRFGPPIRAWHEHKVIAPAAKIAAVSMMSLSFAIVTVFIAKSWVLPTVLVSVMLPAALYVVTRASYTPDAVPVSVPVKRDR
ncbi:MAG: YbaN family protein [Rhodospirillales bacterium]